MIEHSQLPWQACGGGECPCGFIWSEEDGPVCEVVSGPWGDTFPVLKVVGIPGSIEGELTIKTEMDLIEYAAVSPEVAEANTKFIVHACNSHEALAAVAQRIIAYGNKGIGQLTHIVAEAEAALAKPAAKPKETT